MKTLKSVLLFTVLMSSAAEAQLTPNYTVKFGQPPYSEGYSNINETENAIALKSTNMGSVATKIVGFLSGTDGWQYDNSKNLADYMNGQNFSGNITVHEQVLQLGTAIEKSCRTLAARIASRLNQYQHRVCTPNPVSSSSDVFTVSFWVKTPIDPTIQIDSTSFDPASFNESMVSLESSLTITSKVLAHLKRPLPKSYWDTYYKGFEDRVLDAGKRLEAMFKNRPDLKGDKFPPHPEATAIAIQVLAHYQFYFDALVDLTKVAGGDTDSYAVRSKNLLDVLKKTMTILKNKYGYDESQDTRFGFVYGTVAEDLIQRLLGMVIDSGDQTLLLELRKRIGVVKAISAGSGDSSCKTYVEEAVNYWSSSSVQSLYKRSFESRNKELSSTITLLDEAIRKLADRPHKIKVGA